MFLAEAQRSLNNFDFILVVLLLFTVIHNSINKIKEATDSYLVAMFVYVYNCNPCAICGGITQLPFRPWSEVLL